jgi:hypothetical protein
MKLPSNLLPENFNQLTHEKKGKAVQKALRWVQGWEKQLKDVSRELASGKARRIVVDPERPDLLQMQND